MTVSTGQVARQVLLTATSKREIAGYDLVRVILAVVLLTAAALNRLSPRSLRKTGLSGPMNSSAR